MNEISTFVSIVLLVLSWGLIGFGMIAIFRLRNLYSRIISATTIDSVASLTILIALLVFRIVDLEYVIRFILLIAFLLITNPISSHVNIRSAFLTGYKLDTVKRLDKEEGEENG